MFGQLLVGGIAVGCIYALIGLGYSLIYSASALMSFVQGEIFMLGAYVAYTIYVSLHIPFVLAVLLAIGIMFLFGIVLQRGMISPLLETRRPANPHRAGHHRSFYFPEELCHDRLGI